MVHAHLHRLVCGGVGAVHFESGHVACNAHRFTPGGQCGGHIAFGHDQPVAHAHRDAFEADFGLRLAQGRTTSQGGQHRCQRHGRSALQETAARGRNDLVDVGVGRAVTVFHGAEVFGHDGFTPGLEIGRHFCL